MVQRCPAAAGQRPCACPISRNPGTHSRRRTSAIPDRTITRTRSSPRKPISGHIPTARARSSPAAKSRIRRRSGACNCNSAASTHIPGSPRPL